MILLLEPPRPAGFVSGGYRYQAEIGARLAARGEGELRVVAPDALAAAVAAARGPVVVDGLFAALGAGPLPAGAIALLHLVPPQRPWSAAPLPVVATSLPTAAAVAADSLAVEVVRPGLDACFVPGPPRPADGRRRIVCIGTVSPAKGQLLLATAVAAARCARQCDLVLLGDALTWPDHARAVERAAAPATVAVRGAVPPTTVADELRRADLFVSASRSESFGMAVAEAVACGAPVLAFATGEIATFVRDGGNGWLLPADADDGAFAARLGALLADPAALRAARDRAVRPPLGDWDQAATRFAAACRRLHGGPQKRSPT
ncbi:MAG: glycosyltransferase family 4 protein [Planctomycetes bacterium]|nr:glycosyltransferase family 4 protein [Planctomycetota bacterium]